MCCPRQTWETKSSCLEFPVSHSARAGPVGTPGTSACPQFVELLNTKLQQLQLLSFLQSCVEVAGCPRERGLCPVLSRCEVTWCGVTLGAEQQYLPAWL